MIISEENNIVFIHIPKCAGTSLRNQLEDIDDAQGKFSYVKEHSELGYIDFAHIPLFILRQSFPVEYKKILACQSYAILRDPYERFPSSVSEHIKMYGEKRLEYMSLKEVENTVEKIIKRLSENIDSTEYLPIEYTHFQRQYDFVYDQGVKIVDNLYSINNLEKIIDDINKKSIENYKFIKPIQHAHLNKSYVYKYYPLRLVATILRPVWCRIFSLKTKKYIKKRLLKIFFVQRNTRLESVLNTEYTMNFVSNYYKKDIELYESIKARENIN